MSQSAEWKANRVQLKLILRDRHRLVGVRVPEPVGDEDREFMSADSPEDALRLLAAALKGWACNQQVQATVCSMRDIHRAKIRTRGLA